MDTKTVDFLLVLLFGGMPLWIGSVMNPLWPINVKRIVLSCLLIFATIFYIDVFRELFTIEASDKAALLLTVLVLIAGWTLTLFRAYQLWPRKVR